MLIKKGFKQQFNSLAAGQIGQALQRLRHLCIA